MAKRKTALMTTTKSAVDNATGIENMGKMGDGLSRLNTMRGGEKGFKGFVAEEMQAAEYSAQGQSTAVINNNGPADLIFTGKNGRKYLKQMKMGYRPGQIDFSKYKGQTVVVDKGNPYFKQLVKEGKAHGVKVVEGTITNEEAKALSKAMQIETKITGAEKATIVPKVAAAHKAGLQAGKTGALYGAGFSFATNTLDVLNGDKEVGEAAKSVLEDTAISYGAGYAVGVAGSAFAGTSVGASAIASASAAGFAITGTTVGGAVIGAAGAATGAVAAAGTSATGAIVGAVGTVGSAVGGAAVSITAGTAVGGAVAAGVGATTAAAAAVGAAAVASAPVVAVGVAAGVVYKGWKWIFGSSKS